MTPHTLDHIAAQLQGYDPQSMTAEAVQAFLKQWVQPVSGEVRLGLMQALGHVLAHDVISPIHVPAHDNSAMDGYAFSGAQLDAAQANATLTLTVVGTALAGKMFTGQIQGGQCVQIMTGAVMPPGLDTVVPQELVQVSEKRVTFTANAVRPGDNCRKKGEDIAQGHAALRKGARITPAALGLLASLGVPQVDVVRRLRVAYFSTGDEILSLGEPAREGAVYDSNRYTLFGLMTRMGIEVIDMGVVRDDPTLLEAAFRSAAAQADAIITSGGVSGGEADHTKALMQKLGDVAFWKVAMRPGRPMAVGTILSAKSASSPHGMCASSYENNSNSTLLFGLPGNPVAAMVTFLAFVRPALLQMMGCSTSPMPLLQARSVEAIRKKPGRTEYQRAIVSTAPDGSLIVKTTGSQGSGVLSSMVHANGLLVLGHAQGHVAAGDTVNVLMFEGVV